MINNFFSNIIKKVLSVFEKNQGSNCETTTENDDSVKNSIEPCNLTEFHKTNEGTKDYMLDEGGTSYERKYDDGLFCDITIDANANDEKNLNHKYEISEKNFEMPKKDFKGFFKVKSPSKATGFKLSPIGKERYDQMKFYENMEADQAVFVPFQSYYPCYEDLNTKQKQWYFFWRKKVRSGQYPKTDLSYIFIYIYELLCNVGVENPNDGLKKLMEVWQEYKKDYPKLNSYLADWTFDYCKLHNLDYKIPNVDGNYYVQVHILNHILYKHEKEHPLKLPINLISPLSTYKFTQSTFFKKYPHFVDRLIPRIISLIDIFFWKKYNQGLLRRFVPRKPIIDKKPLFVGTMFTEQNLTIASKHYNESSQLCGIISEAIRFSENVLRELTGAKGRLKRVTFEEDYPELSKLIKIFIIRNYDDNLENKNTIIQDTEALECAPSKQTETLNFDKIKDLRKQSEGVRTALEVAAEEEVILLTDVVEIQTILAKVSDKARSYLIDLQLQDWNTKYDSSKQAIIDEINRVSGIYIARDLIIVNGNSNVEIEYDYRDELEYIYQNNTTIGDLKPSKESVPMTNTDNCLDNDNTGFNTELLSDELVQFINALTMTQKNVLLALLTKDSPYNIITDIANQAMSMPEMLLDEINESASEYLGELLLEIDGDAIEIIEPFKSMLKKSIGTEE